jgi:hypothetical protein
MKKQFKLTAEMVPPSTWWENLRRYLYSGIWDALRKSTYAKYDHCCGICNAKGKLHCHEIWKYDDINHIQKLIGLIALCENCHQLKHLYHTSLKVREGKINLDKLIDHFTKVNNCSIDDFREYEREVWTEFDERSKYEWIVDYGEFQKLIDQSTLNYQLPLFPPEDWNI